MSKEQNMATQEKLGAAAVAGDFDAFDEVFAEDVVDHDPAPNQGPGPDGFKDFFTYTLTGTHEGEFHDLAATGKKIKVRGMQIARFEDGKIVERWGATDELSIMRQVGAFPA